MVIFIDGAVAMGCAVASLLFLRFWRDTREGLLLMFALAFSFFAISYGLLGLVPFANEHRPYVFVLRLVGFIAIFAGIYQKNRGSSRRG